jgi:hypothetical protein
MGQDAHEPQPREGLDIPFELPPEEYLYRCGVCGAEMLVHEAIMDVALGAATFCGDSRGGMPTLGCPGYNGEPLEYVAQKPSSTRRVLGPQPTMAGHPPVRQKAYRCPEPTPS